jgi:hypothetical protein
MRPTQVEVVDGGAIWRASGRSLVPPLALVSTHDASPWVVDDIEVCAAQPSVLDPEFDSISKLMAFLDALGGLRVTTLLDNGKVGPAGWSLVQTITASSFAAPLASMYSPEPRVIRAAGQRLVRPRLADLGRRHRPGAALLPPGQCAERGPEWFVSSRGCVRLLHAGRRERRQEPEASRGRREALRPRCTWKRRFSQRRRSQAPDHEAVQRTSDGFNPCQQRARAGTRARNAAPSSSLGAASNPILV